MVRAIRTNSEIFFPDPIVVRVQFSADITETAAHYKYSSITRQTYKLIKGTWGHSRLEMESVKRTADAPPQASMNSNHRLISLAALFGDSDIEIRYRGYFCFTDEMDVLQFRLTIDETARDVKMWPTHVRFTIHEFLEE